MRSCFRVPQKVPAGAVRLGNANQRIYFQMSISVASRLYHRPKALVVESALSLNHIVASIGLFIMPLLQLVLSVQYFGTKRRLPHPKWRLIRVVIVVSSVHPAVRAFTQSPWAKTPDLRDCRAERIFYASRTEKGDHDSPK